MSRSKHSRTRVADKGRLALVLVTILALATASCFVVRYINQNRYSSEGSFRRYARRVMDSTGGKQEVGSSEKTFSYGEPVSVAQDMPSTGYDAIDAAVAGKWSRDKDAFGRENRGLKPGEQAAIILTSESYKTPCDVVSCAVHTFRYRNVDGRMVLTDTVDTYICSAKQDILLRSSVIFKSGWLSIYESNAERVLKDELGDKLTDDYKDQITANSEHFIMTEDSFVWFFDSGTVAPDSEGVIRVELKFDVFKGFMRDDIGGRVIDPSKPMVAITYDDGPSSCTTPELLDIYEQNGAVCTFFEVGKNCEKCDHADEILKRELDLGCELGVHSYAHDNLERLTDDEIRDDAGKAIGAVEKASGQKPAWLRPPYGEGSDSRPHRVSPPGQPASLRGGKRPHCRALRTAFHQLVSGYTRLENP